MRTASEEDIVAELVARCRTGFVGLWEVVSAAVPLSIAQDVRDSAGIERVALDVVRPLLAHPDIVVGEFEPVADGTFGLHPWPKQTAAERIEVEWERLARKAGSGVQIYFTTDRYRRRVRLRSYVPPPAG